MLRYANVRSTAPTVHPIETDEYHIYINNGIRTINEPDNEEIGVQGFKGHEIEEQLVYEKDEYIALISAENIELKERNIEVEGTVNSILTDIIPNLLGI